jgi:hypothetical protein
MRKSWYQVQRQVPKGPDRPARTEDRVFETMQGPRQHDRDEHRDHRGVDENEQVPPNADPPQHEPTQKATYASFPFGCARHDER